MSQTRIDVLTLGNAIVDVLAHTDEAFLLQKKVHKGAMQLIDEARAEELYGDMGPAVIVSGGSGANTAAGVTSFGVKAGFIGKVKNDETGKLFAIDRSESGVDRTKRRCAKYVEAGRLTVRQIDLATLRVPVKRLNKVFAFNVNLFWVRKCDDEVALLHERVLPGGAVYFFYEANRPELIPNIVTKASKALTDGGFRVFLDPAGHPFCLCWG